MIPHASFVSISNDQRAPPPSGTMACYDLPWLADK
jgi:hypothetical protein